MSFHQIATFFLIMGCAALIIGVADIAVTVIGLRAHKVWNSLIGVAFVVLGITIVWLTQQGNAGKQIDLGPVLNKLSGGLLLLLGIGAFVLRTAMSIRDGQTSLQAENLSRFTVWRSRFQIAFGIVFIVLLIGMLAWFILQAAP